MGRGVPSGCPLLMSTPCPCWHPTLLPRMDVLSCGPFLARWMLFLSLPPVGIDVSLSAGSSRNSRLGARLQARSSLLIGHHHP